MSTKTTILWTENEHWYDEMMKPRSLDGKHVGNDIHIQIASSSMVFPIDSEYLEIVIRADSELAKKLRKLKFMDL